METIKTQARTIAVRQLPIELSQLVKFSGLAASGGDAKRMITEGKVLLNGAVETQKGKKLQAGDIVTVAGQSLTVARADL
jgi:ribosome-associated protein